MKPNVTHLTMCSILGIKNDWLPAPEWKPYAMRAAVIEVFVEGKRHCVFGGTHRCSTCGYGIDIQPDGDACPECGATSCGIPAVNVGGIL